MSITDELRRYISGPAKNGISHICEKAIINIAERIDEEHESACVEAYGNGVESVELPDMTAYVKLPVDTDGVPIRVGDVLEVVYLDGTVGKPFEVHSILLEANEWFVSVQNGSHSYASRCRHYHAPTVEDVLREFAQEMSENIGMYTSEAIDADEWRDADNKTIAEYAAKLRLAGDAE